MSISQSKAVEMLETISKKFKIDMSELYECVGDTIKRPNVFCSAAAKNLAEENKDLDLSKIEPSGKNGKITVDDIRKLMGAQTKAKVPSLWGSSAAKSLAEENNLKESDFSEDDKSGTMRKSGKKSILIVDIRKKLGIETPSKSKKTTSKKSKKSKKEETSDEDE